MAEDMALRLLMASPALDVATGLVIGRLVHHDIDALLAVQDGRDRAREAVGAIRKRGWCIAEERDDMAVDCGPGAVGIRHSYDELGNLKGTKTKAGTRLLPLPDITARGGCSPPRGSRPSTSSASTSCGERRERPAPSGTLSRPTRRP